MFYLFLFAHLGNTSQELWFSICLGINRSKYFSFGFKHTHFLWLWELGDLVSDLTRILVFVFTEACSLLTPLHIVPEWYFLCQYAMLKAVPNKNAGFIILLTSILTLFLFGEIRNLSTFIKFMSIFTEARWNICLVRIHGSS